MLQDLENDDNSYDWVGVWQGIELSIYGDSEKPQLERLPIAQQVIQSLASIQVHAQTALNHWFNLDPLDDLNVWTLLTIYFGVDGKEPVNEFKLHFGLGIWDWSTEYYVLYRLDSDNPEQSTLIGCSVEY